MEALTRAIGKVLMSLLVITAITLTALPQAEAFKLTITNNYDKAKSFSILYHEDSTNKWLCRGWYTVPAGTSKEYNFSSSSPSHAYIYSSVWNGEGEEGAVRRTVISDKFKYYDGETCPQGSNRHQVTFSKFGMCVNGAHLIWGDEPQATGKTQTTSQTAGITKNELLGIELLNNDRSKQGLPRLVADARLTEVARNHAADMVANNYFNHTNLQGQSPFDRIEANGITYKSAGENIAYNYSVEKLEEAWMNSPGHRANILNTGYTHVGLGLYPGKNGSLYGVQVFASY